MSDDEYQIPELSWANKTDKAADFRKDVKRIADALERIAKFIDGMQGIIDTEYQKKLKREKERKRKVKKDG